MMQTKMVHSIFKNLLVLTVCIDHFQIIFSYILFFEDPQEFGLYDTNRDGLVDAPEYARGEGITKHRCKLYILLIFFEKKKGIFVLVGF
jgi:hypothetical protein